MSGPPGGGGVSGNVLALHNTFETFYGHLGLTGSKREALWNNFKAGGKAQADSVLHTIVPPSQESRGNPQPSPYVDQSGRPTGSELPVLPERGVTPTGQVYTQGDTQGPPAQQQYTQGDTQSPPPQQQYTQGDTQGPPAQQQYTQGPSTSQGDSQLGTGPKDTGSSFTGQGIQPSEFDTWANSLPGLTGSQREALQNNYNSGGLGAAKDIYTKHFAPRPPVDQSTREPQPPAAPPQQQYTQGDTNAPAPPPQQQYTQGDTAPPPSKPPAQQKYTQGDNNAPPFPPSGGGPPGGNTSFVTTNVVDPPPEPDLPPQQKYTQGDNNAPPPSKPPPQQQYTQGDNNAPAPSDPPPQQYTQGDNNAPPPSKPPSQEYTQGDNNAPPPSGRALTDAERHSIETGELDPSILDASTLDTAAQNFVNTWASQYYAGGRFAPPPGPPHLGGSGPPGGNTSFVTSNEVTTQDPVEVKLPWEEDEVENVVWQPPPRKSMGAANRQGDRLDQDPAGSAPPATTVVGDQGDRLDKDPAGSAPPSKVVVDQGDQGTRLDKDPTGSVPPPKSTEWWTQKDRLDQDPPGGGDGSVKKGWDWSNFQGDRPDQDPSGSAPPPAISPGGQETRLDQDPVGSSPPPAGAPPPAQGGPGDFPPPTDDPPPGGVGPGDVPPPPPGEPPPASPPPASPPPADPPPADSPPATQPPPAEANPLAFLGRGNQTGIEQRLQQISNQIEVDAEAEVRRQQAVAEQQFQTQREDLARMFSISPGSRGANLSGDQQRDFEQLASAEAQTLANIDAQVRAQARAEGRENLATLLGIQSGVQAGDLAVRGQGLEETQVFGEEQGASMADFGIPAGTQLTMDNLDQMSQIVQSGFFQKFNRAPTNGELMTILQGGTTGGTTTLAAEAQESAAASTERQLDITETGQERQLDIAETGQERELDLAEQAQEFAEETGRARTDLAERAQEYAEEAGRAQIGLQSAELFGGTEGLTMGSLGIDPNASDFDQFAAFDKFGEAFNSQYNRPPTAEEMDDFLQGKAVGARRTFQSSQFGQTFAESTRQFNSTFLGDMIDPATGQIREGLDKQQVQAGINKLNADMGNAERALTADIAQQWSQITGETTSEGPVTLSDLTGMDSEGIGRALMDGSMTQEQVLNSVRQGFTAMTGREPTDEELNALSSAGTVNVMGAPTLEAKRLASTVSQANMDRAVSYKQIATQEGLDYAKIKQLDDQADREWQRITLDVASQIGADPSSWQSAVQAYEQALRDGLDPDTALTKAHTASRHPTTGAPMEMGDLNRGISIWTRDFGSSNEQLRRSFEMQEDQFARTIDGLSRQEERENAVWNGLLGTEPVDITGVEGLLAEEFVTSSEADLGQRVHNYLDNTLGIRKYGEGEGEPAARWEDGGSHWRSSQHGSIGQLIPITNVTVKDDRIDKIQETNHDVYVTLHLENGTRKEVRMSDWVGQDMQATDFAAPESVSAMQGDFDRLTDEEKRNRVRLSVESRYNITPDNEEIDNILAGNRVTFQPAPRDLISHFGRDKNGVQLLNAFTSWVTGASPFSDTSGQGLASTIGQFAGHAAVGFASGGGASTLIDKIF